ncbi:MAG: diguanylate cyclase [Trueperaceae bacterium]|nr:diguanylate cyclase [Trueperaceae bacterium]
MLGKVTFSLGCLWQNDGQVYSLLHIADEALYKAKQQGRNRLVIVEGVS